jgi:hypothetical protein
VRYLLEKGANTELLDSNGRKAIDLAGGGVRAEGARAPITATGNAAAGGGTRGGPGGGGVSPAGAAEVRALLQSRGSRQ